MMLATIIFQEKIEKWVVEIRRPKRGRPRK
jgi:hypothetical protein